MDMNNFSGSDPLTLRDTEEDAELLIWKVVEKSYIK